jgi:hypothetical protein
VEPVDAAVDFGSTERDVMKNSINLLPLRYRRRQLLRRMLASWLLVWIACLGIGIGVCGLAWRHSQSLEQAALAAERTAGPLKQLVDEQATMQSAIGELDAKAPAAGAVQSDRPVLTLIGLVSQSAQRCQGRLVVEQLSFERKDKSPAGAGKMPPAAETPPDSSSHRLAARPGVGAESPNTAPAEDEPWGRLTVRGDALDNLAVATFVVGLRDSGVFRHVELKSCNRSLVAGHESRSYLVECDL